MAEKQKKIARITGDIGIVKIWERTFIRNKRKSRNWTRRLTFYRDSTHSGTIICMEMQKLHFWQGNFLNLPISLTILHPPSLKFKAR